MRTTAAPSFLRFLAIVVGSLALLSLAWFWVGVAYNAVLLRAVSPILPDGVALQREGHQVEFTALLGQGGAPSTVLVMHTMEMTYGLIVAAALLLAAPRFDLRARLLLVVAAVLLTFSAHWVGLLVIVDRVEAMVRLEAQPGDVAALGRTLTLVWLAVPSLVWLPALLWSWRRVGTGSHVGPATPPARPKVLRPR